MQLQDQTLNTLLSTAGNPIAMGAQTFENLGEIGNALAGPRQPQDGISRFVPPQPASQPASPWLDGANPIASLLQQIQNLMTQLGRMLGGNGSWGDRDGDRYFASATGGSNGDPHLSFNGQTWNSMVGHGDLLNSDSIPGGFRISTATTPPDGSGVTYNRQATVTTDFGAGSVTLDNAGNAFATCNGERRSLTPGQTLQLGAATMATCNADGSVTVIGRNQLGGVISTTMRHDGSGVDVNTSAENVELGGDLVLGQNQPAPPPAEHPL